MITRAKKILFNIEKGEDSINGIPALAEGDQTAPPEGHQQLSLFGRPEYAVIKKLQKLDISKMTPLDAINCLNELQEKVKN